MAATLGPVPRSRWLATLVGLSQDAIRIAESGAGPLLDLSLRFWLAIPFLASATVKIADWDNALLLATDEYPVSWMEPASAAFVGVSVELIFPVLIALGLATRLAAVPLLALSLVIQLEYLALTENVFWVLFFGWYIVMGAGPISLDRLLARGFSGAPLPFADALSRFYRRLSARLGPIYQLLLRCWLASAFLLSALTFLLPETTWPAEFGARYSLPVLGTAGENAAIDSLWLVLAALLLVGLSTRIASLLLVLTVAAVATSAASHPDHGYLILMLGLLITFGPGAYCLDRPLLRALHGRYPQIEDLSDAEFAALPQVVVVGAGFGGLTAAVQLRRSFCRVTIIDRHNYHLFQPLLYQVATAALSPADIAMPVRGLFRDQRNARVLLGKVADVDTHKGMVDMDGKSIPYDYLVLATGARHSYFGRDEWAPHAPGLKRIEDATEVRRRLLIAFELAENSDNPEEQQSLLTFIIVGAGPTGVELAGAIAELAHHGMQREFRHIDPTCTRVILVQSGPRVLPAFPEGLSEVSRLALEKLGVEVLTGHRVEGLDAEGVVVAGKHIASRTVFWAAGVVASPAARWLGAQADRAGRIRVQPDLSVPDLPNVFAIGDTASVDAWDGHPVPGLAPAAKQAGMYVAALLRARLDGRPIAKPFRYRHPGSLATIGRKAAVADFGFLRLSGGLAWWLWGFVHVAFMVGMRNRISVMFDWFWAYLTFKRSTRLITGQSANE